MSDPQSRAEQLDEEELPSDLIPEKFIEAEDWDQGAGADEADDDVVDPEDSGLEHESPIAAEDAAMHIERGISEG
jgi:hypothetical protein